MTEGKKETTLEEKIAVIDAWTKNFSESGIINEIDSELLLNVLRNYGAYFEELEKDPEVKSSLQEYSNKRKHKGMQSVWGDKRKNFRMWTEEWADEYEATTGEKLPVINFEDEDTGEVRPSRTEGMRQYFGELTSYAAKCLEGIDFKERLEARHFNFHRKKEERKRIQIPGYNNDKSFAPASFPPEYPNAAWGYIKTWGKPIEELN